MRILHAISSIDPQSGGPTAALLGLAGAQAATGLNVSVVASYQSGTDRAAADRLREAGIAVRMIGPCGGVLSRHPDMSATVSEMVAAADVVHIHGLWEEIQHQTSRAAQRMRRPYIIRPCGMLDPWSLSQSSWKKKLYMFWRMRRNLERAAALHFTAEAERDLTQPLSLLTPAIVEPNGVDLEEFANLPRRGAFRDRHPEVGDRKMVLFLGRLHPGKGMEYLIPAFAKADVSGSVLVAVGPDSGGFRAVLEDMAQQFGVRNQLIFTGLLRGRDKVAALHDADLFCLPSEHENFGLAVVEALAAGCPVLISDQVRIHREIVDAGVGAAVPLEIDRLADELRQWLTDTRRLRAAGSLANAFVRDRYTWGLIARRWSRHYDRLARPACVDVEEAPGHIRGVVDGGEDYHCNS